MTAPDSDALTSAEFDALFDSFTTSVVRLEQLPAYSVGGAEAERIAAWRRGEPRPERSVRTSPWLARIATSTVIDGKCWSRIRVVDDPLTEYQRYQLESYRESQAIGEEVRVIARDVAPENRLPDFWLFDAGTDHTHAVWMRYGNDGRLVARLLITDPDVLHVLPQVVSGMREIAVPLNEFLASTVVRGG